MAKIGGMDSIMLRILQMLYTKLFIVMGILWMAECLEFLLQTKPPEERGPNVGKMFYIFY
jgi:hypothetical protein